MKNKSVWIAIACGNLCIVAFLGMVLRTKFLFPLPFIDYKNLLNAHSHFAFGGWMTLILMVLMVEELLRPEQRERKVYQVMLGGIQFCSTGMLLSFPFQGYGIYSIIFSTLFIFFTYAFSLEFIGDIRSAGVEKPVSLLAVFGLLCLVLSSAGPFFLAYLMVGGAGSAGSVRDAICFYLHFQYNGFFIPAAFALFFQRRLSGLDHRAKQHSYWFALALVASVPPSLFLALLWRLDNAPEHGLAIAGAAMTLLALVLFVRLVNSQYGQFVYTKSLAGSLLVLSMAAFVIKMFLQVLTVIPGMADTIFGYRPIIIGFLHLVFLGEVTLYIFSHMVAEDMLPAGRTAGLPLAFFAAAVVLNEVILLVNGLASIFGKVSNIYGWLLWMASIMLFTGTFLILLTALTKIVRRKYNYQSI